MTSSSSDREIITLQLGPGSNFVGTHWWNMQESSFVFDRSKAETDETRLNHDVLFREGKNSRNKITYTPRLVAIDYADNIGRTNLSRNLYPPIPTNSRESSKSNFGMNTNVFHQSIRPMNQFLADLDAEEKSHDDSPSSNHDRSAAATTSARVGDRIYHLDDSISMWTDYLRVAYHPKSLLSCPNLNSDGSLSRFVAGESAWTESKMLDEFEDRLRFFAEDSNCLQGFHLLCDIHDGTSGIVSKLVQYLSDEYARRSIMAMAVILPDDSMLQNPSDQSQYVWNSAAGLSALTTNCEIVVPLSTCAKLWTRPSAPRRWPNLNYKPNLLYHTSAIIAAALETTSTPWRRRSSFEHLSHVCDALGFNGRKLASLSASLPLGVQETKTLDEFLRDSSMQIPISLTPYMDSVLEEDAAVKLTAPRIVKAAMRGVKELTVARSLQFDPVNAVLKSRLVSDLLEEKLRNSMYSVSADAIYEPIHTKTPFPHIFSERTKKDGMIIATGNKGRTRDEAVTSSPCLTWLESNPKMVNFVRTLHEETSRLNSQKARIEKDLFEEIVNNLNVLIENC